MAGSGRRRQVTTPLRRRLRRDVLVWGLIAGVAATLALGLTGGGWVKAVILGVLVLGGCVLLTVLSATVPSTHPGSSHGSSNGSSPGSAPGSAPAASPPDEPPATEAP